MSLKLGIIGGSGLYNFAALDSPKIVNAKDGPFGKPSGDILSGKIDDIEIFFLPRHGQNHSFSPSNVPYRANVEILKRLGCNDIIAISAVGSLKENLSPGTFVVIDQYIDRTYLRKKTYFDQDIVAHVSMANPTCDFTSELLYEAGIAANISIIKGGTYLVMEGPQFSTYAESNLYRSWGCDVIGMTNMPEAKLAREAEIRYASIAMVTDYDCWREDERNVDVMEIVNTLNNNASKAKDLIRSFVSKFKKNRNNNIIDGIDNCLDNAIISKNVSPDKLKQLGLGAIAKRIINES